MNRHRSVSLFLDPRLRLLVTARGAVTVSAGSSHPVFSAAAFALIADSAQGSGATTCDEGEDLLLSDRERVNDTRPMQTQCVGDGGHGWRRLVSLKQLVDRGPRFGLRGIRQMQGRPAWSAASYDRGTVE